MLFNIKSYKGYRGNDCTYGEDDDGGKIKLCMCQAQVHKHVLMRVLDGLARQVLIAVDEELARQIFERQ
jgi:hypothetical protein